MLLLWVAWLPTSVTFAQTAGRPSLELRAPASDLSQLRSLVSWHGELIAEHYATGVRATPPANVKSAYGHEVQNQVYRTLGSRSYVPTCH